MKHAARIRSASLGVSLLIALCGQAAWSQPAIINEWSQGCGGAREWVEILVVQDGLDMRGFKLTNGANVPSDGLVFNPAFSGWGSVPAGTLIVIYNANSRDLNMPPDDLAVTGDGNWAVVAPHNNRTLFSSGAWQTFPDNDNTAGPRLWNSAGGLLHDWDQGDAAEFMTIYPGSGYGKVFQGGSVAEASDPGKWNTDIGIQGSFFHTYSRPTPGKENEWANTRWIASLRGSEPYIGCNVNSLDFGPVFDPARLDCSVPFIISGYNLDTSITVSVTPNSNFEIYQSDGGEYGNSIQLNKLGGWVWLDFKAQQEGLYTATLSISSGTASPVTVPCTANAVDNNPTNQNDVIINEYMVGDDGMTPYPSLGGATITGDWAELFVAKGPVNFDMWRIADSNGPADLSDTGRESYVRLVSLRPSLYYVPTGTVVLLVFGSSTAPEDFDCSDGRIVLKASSSLDVNGLSLDPAGDNLVLLAPWAKPIDYVGSLQTNPSSALDPNPSSASEWGLTFQPDFPPIPSNEGCWFSVDAQSGFNNDDGSDTYNTLGYGWNVLPAKTTFTPGAVNPGQGYASIQVSPESLDFGSIPAGSSRTLPLLITNDGTAPLEVNASSAITGLDAGDYYIEAGQLPLTVPEHQTSSLNIVFSPNDDIGLLNQATLMLSHNASSASTILEVPLSGTSLVPYATIEVSPDSLDFGSISAYDDKTLPLLISNEGNIPLQINASSAITGVDAADYYIEAGQLPLTVPQQQTLSLNIVFSPNGDLGLLNQATLALSHNASSAGTILEVPLSGTSLGFATIQVSPASLDFGAISPYDSKVLPLLISNTGVIPLVVSAASHVEGYDASKYVIDSGQFPLTVSPQQTATLNIRFAPNGALGLLDDATLLLGHNDASADYLTSVPLSGMSLPGMSEQLFYEPFDYVAGPLYVASGGVWQHAAGIYGNYEVEDANSLTYPGLRSSLGRLARHGRTFNTVTDISRDEDVFHQFQLYTPPDFGEKPLYASLLVNVASIPSPTLSPNGDYFCHFYEGSSGFGFRGRLYARLTQVGSVPMVQYGLKFSGYGDPVFATTLVPLQETAFLVMKLTMVAEQPDRVELFINPAPDQNEPGSNLLALSAGFDHDIVEGIGAFGLRQGENTIEGRIDEIRVGWTWASTTANSTPPYLVVWKPLWLNREETRQITKDYLQASDMQTPSPQDLTFTLTQLPRHGDLLFSGQEMNLSSRSTFTQDDINSGRISYRQNGDYVSRDGFLFRLSDPDGRFIDSSFDILVGNFARSRYWNQYK